MPKLLTDQKPDENEPRCGNCRFFRDIGEKESLTVCAYDPPRSQHTLAPAQTVAGMDLVWRTYTAYPPVPERWWCGKHERVKH